MIARAETRAIDEEHEDSVTTITFQMKHRVEFGQEVCVVGSVRSLGNWDAEKGAIPLSWTADDIWTVSVTVRRSEVAKLEYKYIVRSESDSTIEWEKGGNHNVLRKASRELTQEDFWDFPGYNCRV